MDGDDLLALALGAVVIAVAATWPVLPGLRRFAGFKTFPPFRAWSARPHPDAAVPVRAGRRLDAASAATAATHGTVVVRTAWRNQDSRDVRPSLRISRPLVPVVSVDGIPASWGWGVTELTLTPGTHLIAVASSHSRCYRQVHLGRGDRIELDYASIIGDTAHRYREAGAEIRELTAFAPRRSGRGAGVYATAAAGAALIAAVVAVAVASPDAASTLIGGAVWGAVALGLGIGIALITASLVRQARARKVAQAAAPAGAEQPEVIVLDADVPQRLAPAPGWAGLGLHLRFAFEAHPEPVLAALAGAERLHPMQRWRSIRIGEPEAPACRPWVPAPLVLLDGRELDASWTRMWMQVAPGEHELVVRVGAPPGQVDERTRLDFSRAEIRRTFTATAGSTLALTFTADITAVPASDRPRLDQYVPRLH
ncbi:hypothetical protein [Glycomyces sp. MUSA5-2]|uniref:hypothetical protein n=1 Tax=Glycomyces sp. MUSA5-2 TaxID=2053002 RepID=UPI0030094F32